MENTSYYIFMQSSDGAFNAFPVEEWHNFNPVIKYKHLNIDEAEEEFNRQVMKRHQQNNNLRNLLLR